MPKAVLHQPLGPLICYKGCRHTEDTQLSKLRYITAFHNTPPSSIWKDEKGGRGCRPSSKATTNCQQELPRPGLTATDKTPLPNSQQNLPQPGQPTQLHRDPVERLLPHQPSLALPCPSQLSQPPCSPARGPQRRLDTPTLPRQLEKGVEASKPTRGYHDIEWEGRKRLQTSPGPTSHPGLIATQQKAPTNCQQELPRPGLTATGETPLPNSQQDLPQPGQPTQLHRDPVERLLPHQPSLALPCPSEIERYTAAQQEVPSDGWTPQLWHEKTNM